MFQSVTQASSNRILVWIRSLLRSNTPEKLFITNPRVRIFLLAFSMLFFELLCIRWITSYVRYLSYFNNFVLFASFLGIGLGMLAARRKRFWFPPFPVMLLILVIVVAFNRFDLRINSTQVLVVARLRDRAPAEQLRLLRVERGAVRRRQQERARRHVDLDGRRDVPGLVDARDAVAVVARVGEPRLRVAARRAAVDLRGRGLLGA